VGKHLKDSQLTWDALYLIQSTQQ